VPTVSVIPFRPPTAEEYGCAETTWRGRAAKIQVGYGIRPNSPQLPFTPTACVGEDSLFRKINVGAPTAPPHPESHTAALESGHSRFPSRQTSTRKQSRHQRFTRAGRAGNALVCLNCGPALTPKRASRRQRHCSHLCWDEARRARNFAVSATTRRGSLLIPRSVQNNSVRSRPCESNFHDRACGIVAPRAVIEVEILGGNSHRSRAAVTNGRAMIPRRSLTRCASRKHERDDLVAPNALASSPAMSGDACEILVPTESRTKKRFAAIKQTVSHSEQGCRCEQRSLLVDIVVDRVVVDDGVVDRVAHKHKRYQHKHVQTTSWCCT
jgi:hypothetical protein